MRGVVFCLWHVIGVSGEYGEGQGQGQGCGFDCFLVLSMFHFVLFHFTFSLSLCIVDFLLFIYIEEKVRMEVGYKRYEKLILTPYTNLNQTSTEDQPQKKNRGKEKKTMIKEKIFR
jgi:hypothetical protein